MLAKIETHTFALHKPAPSFVIYRAALSPVFHQCTQANNFLISYKDFGSFLSTLFGWRLLRRGNADVNVVRYKVTLCMWVGTVSWQTHSLYVSWQAFRGFNPIIACRANWNPGSDVTFLKTINKFKYLLQVCTRMVLIGTVSWQSFRGFNPGFFSPNKILVVWSSVSVACWFACR